jgi:hypothetical protein
VIRRFSNYLDARPVLAVILGTLTAFAILCYVTPSLFASDAKPAHHSRGQV